MRPDDSSQPSDWLRIAERDIKRVEYLLNAPDPEAAGFYLQQAMEKFLKAFLLSKGWKLVRTHDLEVLLNDALLHDPSLEPFRSSCQKVTGFYVIERYPLITGSGVTEEDVRNALQQIMPLIEKLRK